MSFVPRCVTAYAHAPTTDRERTPRAQTTGQAHLPPNNAQFRTSTLNRERGLLSSVRSLHSCAFKRELSDSLLLRASQLPHRGQCRVSDHSGEVISPKTRVLVLG